MNNVIKFLKLKNMTILRDDALFFKLRRGPIACNSNPNYPTDKVKSILKKQFLK